MTLFFKTKGIDSVGGSHGKDAISLGTTIDEGIKSAVGRRIDVPFSPHELAFFLSVVALRYPEAFRGVTRELEGYEPPKQGYDFNYATYSSRVRNAILEGITRGADA